MTGNEEGFAVERPGWTSYPPLSYAAHWRVSTKPVTGARSVLEIKTCLGAQSRAQIGELLDRGNGNDIEFPPICTNCQVCTRFRARGQLIKEPSISKEMRALTIF